MWPELLDAILWLLALVVSLILGASAYRRRDLPARLFLGMVLSLMVLQLCQLAGTTVQLISWWNPGPGSAALTNLVQSLWPVRYRCPGGVWRADPAPVPRLSHRKPRDPGLALERGAHLRTGRVPGRDGAQPDSAERCNLPGPVGPGAMGTRRQRPPVPICDPGPLTLSAATGNHLLSRGPRPWFDSNWPGFSGACWWVAGWPL